MKVAKRVDLLSCHHVHTQKNISCDGFVMMMDDNYTYFGDHFTI